ncbi:AzlD domain-containing protein [Planosporangium flavigriseum]|uniref:Branched-chain amino acid transporter AzlD n=1 Tax=Planosporangium flavigriseum TaxID=373681 RepID=A0A8J3M0B9_9ACTN|nr:AzlD domain-containing protein [Planosporangium flavigriseum]NJC67018.1 AzlD domain-containing protein [Planosporangium flavigriseum]GIG76720.1 branched-chain amino acid transporter AzlD [Planosporangium flavigriseum]
MIWAAVLAGSIGCYLLKLAGLSVPPKVLENKAVQRIAAALPVALLSALIVIQTFTTKHALVVDARAAGLAAALIAVLLRAPFLVIVGVAAATAAVIRLLT